MSYLEELRRPDQTVNPLFAMLGIRAERIDRSLACLRLPFAPGLVQGGGLVAGGVLATLLDEAMAHAVLARIDMEKGQRTATIDMNVTFLAPARPGMDLVAEAVVVKNGKRVVFTRATARAGETEVASATASFLVITPGEGPVAPAPLPEEQSGLFS